MAPAGAALASYALFALPLAMVALPVYLFAPALYVRSGGLALAGVGAVLLAVRVLAALADPLLGWWMARNRRGYPWHAAVSLAPLLLGYCALFNPPALAGASLMAWFASALMLVYLGYGLATIAHQSWGSAIAQGAAERVRLMSAREGCGLLGAVLAAACSGLLGYGALALLFCACLLPAAWLLLRRAPRPDLHTRAIAPARAQAPAPARYTLLAPWSEPRFRCLFGVYAASALAGAIPATLFVFFAADRLGLPDSWAGPLLVLYLLAAAASMPLWAALARRWDTLAAWQASMLLSALVFIWAYALGPGDGAAFAAICVLTGIAGGADLALPPALLAGLAAQSRSGGQEGQPSAAPYFAWWNWCTQLALAFAAGATLPALALLGYDPAGTAGGAPHGTAALAAAYALLPCALKLLAWLLLMRGARGSLKSLNGREI
jgi:Na+/melibiose symporter-like transporter